MPEYTTILVETLERIGLVRLNRPQALNALNRWDALQRRLPGQQGRVARADPRCGRRIGC